jgi:hypothetical protein
VTGRAACAGLLLAIICAGSAAAQNPAPIQSQPLPAPSEAEPAPPAPPDIWDPRPRADLLVLDKVTARRTALTAQVGTPVTFGPLTITVRACLVRPPDRAADAAAFLDIADSHPDQPGFHGWILLSDPAVSMFEHPVYDVRLVGCRS